MNNENDMNNIANKDGKTFYAEYLVSNSLETLRHAADLGYPLAMRELGRRLFHKEPEESMAWYQKAAYYFNTEIAEFQNKLTEDNDTMQPEFWKDVATLYAHESIEWHLNTALRHEEWEKAVALHSVFNYCGYTQYNNIAWAYCELGNYAEALPLAKKAIEGLPEAYVYDTLATALKGLGQYQDALTAFETCRDLYLMKNRKNKVAETEEKIKELQSMLSK